MFGNLLAVGVIIAIFWVVVFGFYLYTSRQQRNIGQEIDTIQQQLDGKSEES